MKHKIKDWKEKVRAHYDKNSSKWLANTIKEPLKYYYEPYFKTMFSNDHLGDYALDVGCGAGTFTFELCKHKFKKIYAMDFSEKMLVRLSMEINKRKLKDIVLIKGDIENMPFEDDYFDFVIVVGVMECLVNKEKALKEIYRILKPGGIASIRWLNKDGVWGGVESIKRLCKITPSPLPTNGHSEIDETLSKLNVIGFEIKKVVGIVILPFFLFPFPVSWLFETLFIKTKLAYKIEGIKNTDKDTIRRWYYSFCTEIRKTIGDEDV